MQVTSVCVCGAGTMGSSIAQLCAQKNIHTILFDVNETVLQKAKNNIENNLQLLINKSKITSNVAGQILQHIVFTSNVYQCMADIIIEAIIEKPAAKIALFNQLAEINHSKTIFATNTSSLSVTAIAQKIMQPQRLAGMHFFNPATIMKLVEIVQAPQTNSQTIEALFVFAKQLEKTAVLCKDAPGFIVNRVARPYYIEALRLAEEGVSYEVIDNLLESTGFKMGPFRLMDLIGNDVNYAVSISVYEQLNKPGRLQPSYLQQQKVEQQQLGKKTGKGFYDYDNKK
jgi:3-hydroxybutyryl-CoA dehydrogenase